MCHFICAGIYHCLYRPKENGVARRSKPQFKKTTSDKQEAKTRVKAAVKLSGKVKREKRENQGGVKRKLGSDNPSTRKSKGTTSYLIVKPTSKFSPA